MMKKRFSIICLILVVLFSFTACGKQETGEEKEIEEIQNGPVDSPEAFIQLGLFIDIESDANVTDRSYEILQNEIAAMTFVYNGLDCELRGSTVYSEYELSGIPNTSDGNVILEAVGDLLATVYTLDPGRVVYWDDGQVNYSLYIHVTAEDEIVKEILSDVVFENHYTERIDVIQDTEDAKVRFAEQIVSAIQNKDMETLSNMLYYPQQLAGGQSAGNAREFLSLPPEEVFTDGLLNAMSSTAVSDMQMSLDGTEYVIGLPQKNVHFVQMEDGSCKITKINN